VSGERKGPTPVAQALRSLLEKSGLGERLEEATIVPEWAERVGPSIAAVTTPLRVSRGILFVAVRSSAWLMELRLMEAEIRERLNQDRSRGRIREVRFVMEG
jgi:predicted nucleic acid-binding Zn ribbon protein